MFLSAIHFYSLFAKILNFLKNSALFFFVKVMLNTQTIFPLLKINYIMEIIYYPISLFMTDIAVQ